MNPVAVWRNRASSYLNRAIRHFRLRSQRRQSLVIAAAVLLVCGASLTTLNRYQGLGSESSSTAAADASDGVISSSLQAWPQLYNVTYYLSEANFLGDATQANTTYTAESQMHLDILQATTSVTFHSKDLQFSAVSYAMDQQKVVCVCGTQEGCPDTDCSEAIQVKGSNSTAHDLVTVSFGSKASAGQSVAIHMQYSGSLLSGLARSEAFDYVDPATQQSESQVLIGASLEPNRARQMLPCFDLPHIKANFSISLQVPDGMVALSTATQQKAEPGLEPGTTLHTFETTPNMSPYLLGVTAGHMVATSALSSSQRNISVWSVPPLSQQHSIALQAGVEGTNFYEGYTGIILPLQKLDFMAIPGKGGAVENWGLLQFDERRLLVNEATEGAYGRWLAADVVCHELGHQWFGDYVTCSDWTNIAVNEGLASFMEYKCISAAFPEMSGQALFQRATAPHGEIIGSHEGPRQTALEDDASPYIPPLLSNSTPGFLAYHPRIPYSKGAAVWHMLEAFLNSAGPDAFREGMRILMSRHALATASLEDVLIALLDGFDTLSQTSEPMQELKQRSMLFRLTREEALALLHGWVLQPGFPLLNMSMDGSATPQGRFYAWGQQDPQDPFIHNSNTFSNTSSNSNSSGSESWYVPLGRGRISPQANHGDPEPVGAALTEDAVVSDGGAGYYRVQYPVVHQQQLLSSLATLTSEDNSTLVYLLEANAFISDLVALSFGGSIDPGAILRAAAAVAASPAASEGFGLHLMVLPIVEALQQLAFLNQADPNTTCGANIRNVTQELLGVLADPLIEQELLVDDKADMTKYQASTYSASQNDFLYDHSEAKVLAAAAMAGHLPAVEFLCSPYSHSLSTRDIGRDPDLGGVVFQLAVAQPEGCKPPTGPEAVWASMLYKWQTAPDIQEAERGLYALPWASDPDLLRQTLNLTFAGERVVSRSHNNNPAAILRNVGSNPGSGGLHGSDVAWAWVRENFAGSKATSALPILEALPLLPTQQNLDSLRAFLGPLSDTPLAAAASKARMIAKLEHELHWTQTHLHADSSLCLLAGQLATSLAADDSQTSTSGAAP